MSHTSAGVKATDLVAEEAHHLTDPALDEREQLEINGYQIDEILTDGRR